MAEFLETGNNKDASSEATIKKLEEHLGGKRYLLVLDDIWNTNQDLWDSMRNALERIGGSKDSMILTTTRANTVAKTMHASPVHLSELSNDDSWSLFKQIAFANWSNREASTGRKFMRKCQGVPLAIKSIAGLLNKKTNAHEWINIEKYELICRWMALGFLQNSSNGNITMEDVGEEYLNELLSISFLLVHETNELGEATGYILHDLVYDLARSVAMQERLYLEASKKEYKAVDIQHLTIHKHAEVASDFSDKKVLEYIRSLDMFEIPLRGLLVHVMNLRVLSVGHSTIEVVPESISKLKCFKYLDLENNPIKVLPNCINKLYNLQSVSLYRCKPLFEIPRGLSNLVNLRHLRLSFHFCPNEEGVIGQLMQLQTLPPLQLSEGGFQISELGCLDHVKGTIDIKGLELIKNKLDSIMSKLSTKSRVEQLRLTWDSDDNNINHEEVLDGLHPNPNLKLLSLKGYGGGKFPSWLMRMNVPEDYNNNGYAGGTLCNLIKIELIDCKRCQQLPTMGHLPWLKLIEIKNMDKLKRIGPELYCDADLLLGNSNEASSSSSSTGVKSMVYFASLKELRLSGLENLEEWCEPAGPGTWTGFPTLEVLVIEGCWKLKEVPNKFPVLEKLTIKQMNRSNPLMKIMSNKSCVSNLTKLKIEGVEELKQLPEEVGECTSLQTLVIWGCPNLECIPNLSGLGSLCQIQLLGNDRLRGAPEGLESCKSLEKLWMDCCGEIVPNLAGLSRLKNLGIWSSRKMVRQPPEWIYNLPSLRILHIGRYEGRNEEFPDISWVSKITCLEELQVTGWEELQNLPGQLQHLTGLKILAILDFEKVEHLPDWLGNFSSLQALYLTRCERFKELPSKEAMDRLRNFSYLRIEGCPLLEQAVQRDGPEYHKIASPNIEVEIFDSAS